MNFDKIYGAQERQDGLYKIGRDKYEVVFGYGSDGENGWNYRKQYKGYKPTLEELKKDITALINEETDKTILEGFTYEGAKVWLSSENQFNYKCAYDLAVQTEGKTLPVKVKLGTDEEPVFKEFTTLEEFTKFYVSAVEFIQATLDKCWEEKYSVDWSKFVIE